MANYAINITDAGSDTWTIGVKLAPTLATGGTDQTNGATTAGALATALHKAVECVKNHVVANGHD